MASETQTPLAKGQINWIHALRSLADVPFHPFFFFTFPVLSLLAWNIHEIYPHQAVRSLIFSPLICLGVLAILVLFLRDTHRAAFLTSVAGLLFFSYGRAYDYVRHMSVGGFVFGRHRYLFAFWCVLFLLITLYVIRQRTPSRRATRGMNLVGLVLVLMPSLSLLRSYTQSLNNDTQRANRIPSVRLRVSPNQELPDIYYIILDGYARSDFMTEEIGFDNAEFVRFLEDGGFYVAGKSRTNHNHTAMSLAASLNMTLAQYLGVELVKGSYPDPFLEPIRNSLVRKALEQVGYSTVGFRSGYRPTELLDADVFLSPDDLSFSFGARPNIFEDMLLHTTALRPLLEAGLIDLITDTVVITDGATATQRDIILSGFDNLASAPDTGNPKFIFAHIVALHHPYLFDQNGNPLDTDGPFTLLDDDATAPSRKELYRDQAIYITARSEQMIQEILASSQIPPVIILQADHGSGEVTREVQRVAILNAILIKESCKGELYPTITPINTFRIVFNCYFKTDLPIVSDEVYWSEKLREADYNFRLLPDEPD